MCSVSGGRQGSNFTPSAGCTVSNWGPFDPDIPGSCRSLKENYWCRVDTGRGKAWEVMSPVLSPLYYFSCITYFLDIVIPTPNWEAII